MEVKSLNRENCYYSNSSKLLTFYLCYSDCSYFPQLRSFEIILGRYCSSYMTLSIWSTVLLYGLVEFIIFRIRHWKISRIGILKYYVRLI